ncbi:AMP-binding protein [Trujillonella endophytica]|uniref:Long-chain acyl-CoA synthetase n=1 Tax=Trujillonella endophytica TaxID=673521 RepID=A0A1H8T5J5_9ACTN|nr:AMP-binding protein [Trujillella endophytica]SEO86379.1 long-chain acyl-CoA synthetase [Trujillella endophytica]
MPPSSTVAAAGFYAVAARHPDRIAVVEPDGATVSFGALLRRVNALSHAFRALGLGAGDAVAGVLHNGREYLEVLLATGQLGLYFVPVNYRLAPDEIAYIVQDSGARIVVADAEQAPALPLTGLPAARFVVGGAADGWEPFDDLGSDRPTHAPEDRRSGTFMGYTSGTTGRPKGVRVRQRDWAPEQYAELLIGNIVEAYGLAAGEGVHLVCSPLYHSAPGSHALAFLHAGHTLVVHAGFDAAAALRAVEVHRVTSTHMVPTHFHRLLALPEQVRAQADVSSLQAVVHAGAPCPVSVKRRMIEWLGPIVWEYLGSTEGSLTRVSSAEWLARPGTVGRPIPGLTLQILDDDGQPVPAGGSGTIWFGTTGRPPTFEYHGDPEKTARARRGDLVTAGDVGYVDRDGYLFLQDRRTDLIISGGVNVYPAEVENHLIGHPSVADVAVIGVPDAEWGARVVAVVEPAPGATADAALADELDRFCRAGLAGFKCPRHIEFHEHLPRTPAGKLSRRAVRDAYDRDHPQPAATPAGEHDEERAG